jgi:glyoxylase-like metal-dependent hydrolase (beta-lactamase superfamily II)
MNFIYLSKHYLGEFHMKQKLSIALVLLITILSVGVLPSLAQEPFAPVPAGAFDPSVDLSNGYYVAEINDGVYWITEGNYTMMFLVTGEGVIVVDAPPTIGENILNAIASVTDEPITHVVYSHTHIDHIGAASMYPEDAVIIAHDDTASHLEAKGDPNRPVPTLTFSDSHTLEVGNKTLQLDYKGVNHEPGNIFIYAPEQKVLMLVDVVFPGWSPFRYLALTEDLDGFIAAHDLILEYDFDAFIGGHLSRLGTPEDVEIQKEYVLDIVAAAANANAEMMAGFGAAFGEADARGGANNSWAIFSILMDNVSQQCADEVIPKWVDRLGGVDIFTFDHCWTVTEHQRID